jgi:hypothetical protein
MTMNSGECPRRIGAWPDRRACDPFGTAWFTEVRFWTAKRSADPQREIGFYLDQKSTRVTLKKNGSGSDRWVMSPGGQSNLLLIRRLLDPSKLDFGPI